MKQHLDFFFSFFPDALHMLSACKVVLLSFIMPGHFSDHSVRSV
jgi:hypothetical protein